MTVSKGEYYPYFDWLRGVLAMVVVLSHQGLIAWEEAANLAVQVFFALSGWLIGGILLRTARSDLPRFFFNRAVRIWIPYYVAFGILMSISVLRDAKTAKWWEFVAYKATFVYNLFGPNQLAQHRDAMPLRGTGNHFWSVNAEEQFYLLAPFLLVLITPRVGHNILVWLALAVAAWFTGVYASIVFGVFAAVVVGRYGALHRTNSGRALLVVVAVGSAVGMALGYDYNRIAPWFAIAVVLLLAMYGRQQALGAFVGGVSYPMYLNHWVAAYMLNGAFKAAGLGSEYRPLYHAATLVLGIAVSVFLYWVVDRQLMARRNRMYTRSRGWAALAAAYCMMAIGVMLGLWLTRAQ